VRAQWAISLWNPYTSALAPEQLRLEISNLPSLQIDDEESTRGAAVVRGLSLHSLYGAPMSVSLPWSATPTGSSSAEPAPDRESWLPGRVYSWVAAENKSGVPGSAGFDSVFYSRDINGRSGDGAVVDIPGSPLVDGDHEMDVHDFTASRSLMVTLYAVRAGGDVKLATYTSPEFTRFTTTGQRFNQSTFQFAYVFRLKESIDDPAWLSTLGRDLRSGVLGADAFAYQATVANPENPASFYDYRTVSAPDRLLDRAPDDLSVAKDTPVFELPRAPLLSLGALQHLPLDRQRPFAFGNSWGATAALNGVATAEFFDRYFFSGLTAGIAPTTNTAGELLFPNPLLKPLRKADGARVTLDDIRPPSTTDEDGNVVPGPETKPESSRFFLQGGAFNLNSTNVAAWTAVLRGVRFPAPQAFTYLVADPTTGTADGGVTATIPSSDAQFLRFSQSAQETSDPNAPPSTANNALFRQGIRKLTATEVAAFATAVVEAIKTRHGASGPFRALEEFLAPTAPDAPSLLEQAILDAGINSSIPEFSSQFLTQADVMTALAPVLFPRSDTFVIRTYGEAVNPATAATEGRAWCEAIVQRVPEYFDPSPATGDAAEIPPAALGNPLNTANGRRFKIVSFRWLTKSDI
jgi:hypothetical protein